MISRQEFDDRVCAEMRGLGPEPTVAEVKAAMKRAVELGQPPGSRAMEGMLFQLGLAKKREKQAAGT